MIYGEQGEERREGKSRANLTQNKAAAAGEQIDLLLPLPPGAEKGADKNESGRNNRCIAAAAESAAVL